MTDGEKLQFLAGEVNGLRVVMMALVNSHSDHVALGHQIERLVELQIGITGPMAVTEAFIEGQNQTTQNFKDRVSELIARSS